jgi:hypothetical protein
MNHGAERVGAMVRGGGVHSKTEQSVVRASSLYYERDLDLRRGFVCSGRICGKPTLLSSRC